ncbi:MAG: hypothetical protein IKB50_03490 [Clostridia bacterium]|nr:hypothetical protein [Clostridia bacterium]
MKPTENDIALIDNLYKGRKPFYGELHDHSDSGGTSDGKCTLSEWRKVMVELGLDFAAILDHRQVRHMYLPEWEDGVFIGGTEPGIRLTNSRAELGEIHYNILTEGPGQLEELLSRFPEYEFEGGPDGHFVYPDYSVERMGELIDNVKELGGFYVHPHPKQIMRSDDPNDYCFRDETGIEVFYEDLRCEKTALNYDLWLGILKAGRHIWACAGGDGHSTPSDKAITTIYAEEKSNKSYLKHLRVGDFVCGGVGIRMCMGDTLMGGKCDFTGKRLVVSVSDIHKSVFCDDHKYRIDIINDKGTVSSASVNLNGTNYFAIDAENCKFYRTEIFDETENLRIAVGNPIWNIKGDTL